MPRLRREAAGAVIDMEITGSACADFEDYISLAVYQEWGILYG